MALVPHVLLGVFVSRLLELGAVDGVVMGLFFALFFALLAGLVLAEADLILSSGSHDVRPSSSLQLGVAATL